MVNGFFAGGVAKGLNQGAERRLTEGRLALAEREAARSEQNDMLGQVDGQIDVSVNEINATIQSLRSAGKTPDEIAQVVQPLIESTASLAETRRPGTGATLTARLNSEIVTPVNQADFETTVKQNLPRIEEFIKAAEKAGADLTTLAESPQFQGLVEPITRAAAQQGMDPQQVASQINARIQAAAIRAGQADVQGNVISGSEGVPSVSISALTDTADATEFLGVKVGPLREPDSPTERKILNEAQQKAVEQQALVQDIQVFRDLIEATDSLGPITEATQPLVRAFQEIGISLRDDQPLLESIQARQNLLALKFRNPESGFGLTGSTSDADREFLKSIPGGIGNTKEGAMLASLLLLVKLRRGAELASIRANLLARGEGSKSQAVVNRYKKQVDAIRPEEREFIKSLIQRSPGVNTNIRPGESTVIEGITVRRVQ